MGEPKRMFDSLQAGRALAALMVVVHHADEIMSDPRYYSDLWHRVFVAGHSGVAFFFVLSGAVIFYAHREDIGRPAQAIPYFWKRFRRIYPPYWGVLFCLLALYLAMPSTNMHDAFRGSTVIQSILLVHVTDNLCILRTSWTLFHEIMFYGVFGAAILNRRAGFVLGALWTMASVALLIAQPPSSLAWEYFTPLHLLFAAGIAVVYVLPRIRRGGVILGVSGAIAFVSLGIYENLTERLSAAHDVFYGVFAALALLGAMSAEGSGRITVPGWLRFLSDASYSIYLVHLPVLAIGMHFLFPLWRQAQGPMALLFVCNAVIATAAGALYYLAVEKPLLAALRGPKARLSSVSA